MKHVRYLLIPAALFLFVFSGCYTQLYRPDMESSHRQQQATLYDRYDSTAIDTTLRRDTTDYYYGSYPDPGWYGWGRPRQEPIWGWDNSYSMPGYYGDYYGYDNYYGTPWWYGYGPGYPNYHGNYGNGVPAEPPSKRSGGRRSHDGGGSYANPPAAPANPPTYANPPASTPPPNPPADNGNDDGKRGGKRGH